MRQISYLVSLLVLCVPCVVSAAPIITVKCDEPRGKSARYGSIKDFFSGKETLDQGVVNWRDSKFEGARPLFVLSDDISPRVFIVMEMSPISFEKRGLTRTQVEALASDRNTRIGRIVDVNKKGGIWVQIVEKNNKGMALYGLDSKTKMLVYARTDILGKAEIGNRAIGSWLFFAPCRWYETK